MPKIKTNKSAAKRFRKSKGGKFKRHMAFARHLMTGKSANRKRKLRKALVLGAADMQRVRRMLPYS
ncbi:MAG: 50S ribosomal protein L35 [Candidatus Hydrogenedentes bacterium]|nr:50S ribosomal protein L35 [Candidatus Hydrogenedentota bacterium]